MAFGYDSADFGQGDYATRVADIASGSSLIPGLAGVVASAGERRSRPSAAEVASEVDSRLVRDMERGPDSVIWQVNDYPNKVRRIVNLLQNDERNFAEAARMYRELQDFSSSQNEDLSRVRSYGTYGGAAARELGGIASEWSSGKYAEEKVNLSGNVVTLGDLFGGQGYMANRSRQYSKFGYGQRVADAYLGEDVGHSRAVGLFLEPGIQFGGAGNPVRLPNLRLLNNAAEYVADGDNYKRMVDALGEGGAYTLCREVMDRFSDIGGMTEAMERIVAYAAARRAASGGRAPDGESLVKGVMTALNQSTSAMFSDPAGGGAGKPDASERSWAMLTMLSALTAATDRDGATYDFSDRRVRSAAMDATSTVNLARHDGYSLFAEARASGRNPYSELTSLIGFYMDGAPSGSAPDTVYTRDASDRDMFRSRISSAPVVSERTPVRTGNAGYVSGGAGRASGRTLTSPAAGVLEDRVIGALMSSTRRERLTAGNLGDAMTTVMSDPESRAKVRAAVVSALSDGLYGEGGRVLAEQVLFPGVRDALMSRDVRPFEMHRVLESIALEKDRSPYLVGLPIDGTAKRNAIRAAKNWYLSNVAEPQRFARECEAVVRHLMDTEYGYGYDRESAEARADIVAQQLYDIAVEDGESVRDFIDRFTDVGLVYAPETEAKRGRDGKPEMDKDGKPVMVKTMIDLGTLREQRVGRFRSGGINRLRADPTSQEAVLNREFRAIYERQRKLLEKAAAHQATSDEG